jgi:hypothetical protein
MVTIRPVVKWMQALAALLLLAVGPVVEPSRAEEKALSRVSLGDGGKAIALKREQTVTTRAEAQPEGSDDDGGPDAALADAAASAQNRFTCPTLSQILRRLAPRASFRLSSSAHRHIGAL